MPRTVTAHTAIRNGDVVVVNTLTNEARTAEGGARKNRTRRSSQACEHVPTFPPVSRDQSRIYPTQRRDDRCYLL
jgi:hypothetical protein